MNGSITLFQLALFSFILLSLILLLTIKRIPLQEDDFQDRKRSHLSLCETNDVAFKEKSSGFEHYDFLHYAITEVDFDRVSTAREFFGTQVAAPFIISCMTGGISEADNINIQLAEAAKILHIPLGLGSLRYALDTTKHDHVLRALHEKKGNVPLMANLGAAQLISLAPVFSPVHRIIDILQPEVFVIHINPLQEMLQKNGEPRFSGFLQALELFVKSVSIPVAVKEVGSGLSKQAVKLLLETGVQAIDTAGAGGTSWAAVEILRNNNSTGTAFWDWGIPTSYCIKKIAGLKRKHHFTLIGSGGINTPLDAAKALALGADFAASARIFFHALKKGGVEGVVHEISDWVQTLKQVLFLTGCSSIAELNRHMLIEKKDFH